MSPFLREHELWCRGEYHYHLQLAKSFRRMGGVFKMFVWDELKLARYYRDRLRGE